MANYMAGEKQVTVVKKRRTPEKSFRGSATRGIDAVQRGLRVLTRSLESRKAPPTPEERAAVQEAWNQLKAMGDASFEERRSVDGQILKWK